MTPTLTPLFSVPFAHACMDDPLPLCSDLAALFLAREAADEAVRNPIERDAQHGVFESTFDLHSWPDPPVQRMFGYIHHMLAATVQELSGYPPDVYAQLSFQYHSWFHITRHGGHQGVHNHPMASWSGIFCVDPGDAPADKPRSGSVRFLDPRVGGAMYLDSGNNHWRGQYHSGGYEVQHRPGQLVMFPSHVYHEVFPYWGQRPRIVVAFNAWIQGGPQPTGG